MIDSDYANPDQDLDDVGKDGYHHVRTLTPPWFSPLSLTAVLQ